MFNLVFQTRILKKKCTDYTLPFIEGVTIVTWRTPVVCN